MLEMTVQEPDLVLGGSHLGRGTSYYDKEVSKNVIILSIEFINFQHILF